MTSTMATPGATQTSNGPFGGLAIPADAVRFFIIAASVLAFFGSTTCLCCITYRIRKERMKRVVQAVFEQGAFDREIVRERIAHLRRGIPMVDILKPPSKPGPPRFFEITGRLIEETKEGLDMGNNERSQNPPLAAAGASWAAIQPVSTSVSTLPRARVEVGTYPSLSALTVEQQLALIYMARQGSSSRTRKQSQTAGEDSMMASTVLPEEDDDRVEAIISTLISMPKSRNASDSTESEIVFGTIVFPWQTLSADQSIFMDPGDLPRTIGT